MFLHAVILFFLFDLISFPFRWLCGWKTGEDRLLLRYQVFPKPDAGTPTSDDLITDVLLGPSVSTQQLALEIITPGDSETWTTPGNVHMESWEDHFRLQTSGFQFPL